MIADEAEARDFVEKRADAPAIQRLERLAAMLVAENQRQNLVAAASLSSIWQRHFADSAQLLDHVPRETLEDGPWLDLGTGAGFPGMVVGILRPDLPVVMVESRKRRIEWLEHCVAELALDQCSVAGSNLQAVESFKASVISARAFAPLPKLLNLSARFSTRDTTWLLPKGRRAAQELAELPRRFAKGFHVEQSQTDAESGIIVGNLPEYASVKGKLG